MGDSRAAAIGRRQQKDPESLLQLSCFAAKPSGLCLFKSLIKKDIFLNIFLKDCIILASVGHFCSVGDAASYATGMRRVTPVHTMAYMHPELERLKTIIDRRNEQTFLM
jgi:hypothetical protein